MESCERNLTSYFFLEVFLEDFFLLFGKSLVKTLFILAALFLWIAFFFADLSAKEMARKISLADLLFLARRTATSSFVIVILLTEAFFFEPRRALLAVLVTGMARV